MKNKLKRKDKPLVKKKYVIAAYLLKVDSNGKTSKRTILCDFDKGTFFASKIKDIQQYEKWCLSLNSELNKNRLISSFESKKEGVSEKTTYLIEILLIDGDEYMLSDYSRCFAINSLYNPDSVGVAFFMRHHKVKKIVEIQNINEELVELIEENLIALFNYQKVVK